MAGVAQLWLSLDQEELAFFRVVRRMAIHTAHVVHIVLAAPEVAVLFAVLMASKAALTDLLRGDVLEGEDLRLVAPGFHVLFARPMTGLTALPLRSPTGVVGCFPVRRFLEIFEDILVASIAGRRSDVLCRVFPKGGFCRWSLSRGGRTTLGMLRRGNQWEQSKLNREGNCQAPWTP